MTDNVIVGESLIRVMMSSIGGGELGVKVRRKKSERMEKIDRFLSLE
jgi:hypothetical protein